MPRRHGAIESHVHHDIHERVKKRNKSRLERFRKYVKEHREHYRTLAELIELQDRAIESYAKYKSWLQVLREFFYDILYEHSIKRIHHLFDRAIRFAEFMSLLRDFMAGRARVLFTVEHRMFFARDKVITQVRDELLMSLPQEVRNAVLEALVKASTAKYEPRELYQQYPQLLFFLQRYIAYFKKYPCARKTYAIKITPVTIHLSRYYSNTYYVLRFIKVDDMREDPYLKASRSIDFYFMSATRKPYEDIMNTLTYVGSGTANYSDKVALARDDLRRELTKAPLRRAILQPHWIRRAFAKILGKPELYDSANHCSIYAILSRKPKSAKLYEAQVSPRLLGKRPRRRIKTSTFYMGFRA